MGHEKLYSTLRQKYFWHSMYSDVVKYVQTCDKCQRAKRFVHARPAPLMNLPVEEVFGRVHLDILGPLKATKDKKKYVLLMVDAASRWVEGASLTDQTATTVARAFYENFITRYSAPRSIVSDRGSNVMSQVIKELCTLFNIKHPKTTPYHAQSNSQVERTIQSLSQAMRSFVDQEQENWSEILPSVLMGLRFQTNPQTTGFSPYEIVFGRKPVLPIDAQLIPTEDSPVISAEYVKGLQDRLNLVREIAKTNTMASLQRGKVYHDKKSKTPQYQQGDLVLIKRKRRYVGLSDKLLPHYERPCYIAHCYDNHTYQLVDNITNRALPTRIHHNLLRPYKSETHRPTNHQPSLTGKNVKLNDKTTNTPSQGDPPGNNENLSSTSPINESMGSMAQQPDNDSNTNTSTGPEIGQVLQVDRIIKSAYFKNLFGPLAR